MVDSAASGEKSTCLHRVMKEPRPSCKILSRGPGAEFAMPKRIYACIVFGFYKKPGVKQILVNNLPPPLVPMQLQSGPVRTSTQTSGMI